MTTEQIQHLLTYLGYSPGDCDGIVGKQTRAAILAFQAAEGLEQDGVAGAQTQARLREAVFQGRERQAEATPTPVAPKTGTFWDEIEFFTKEEFRCQCGGKYCNGFPADLDEENIRIDDEIRRRAGVPLRVNSGLRCDRWNLSDQVKGAKNSCHTTGQATDLAPINGDISVSELYDIAVQVHAERIPGRGGIGRYVWGVHQDTGKYSRWEVQK